MSVRVILTLTLTEARALQFAADSALATQGDAIDLFNGNGREVQAAYRGVTKLADVIREALRNQRDKASAK